MSDFVATRVPLTHTSAADMTPLKSSAVRSPVSVPRIRSVRYHHGTEKSPAGMDFMFVEKNGSAYFPAASRAASTVERAVAGTHPLVLKPGLETALSAPLTLADDWIRNPGTAAARPAAAGAVSAAAGAGAERPAATATPVAPTSTKAAAAVSARAGMVSLAIERCLPCFIRQAA